MAKQEFFMKHLIPKGSGSFYVVRFIGETPQDIENVRNELLSEGDWSDASQTEYDNFLSGVKAVGEILGNVAEWARVEGLSEESKKAVREAVQEGKELAIVE